MSLAEAFERVASTVPAHKLCGVSKVRAALSAEEREYLDGLLSDPDVYATNIAQALKAEGHDIVGADAVQRHRRGACSCKRVGASR